jgi:hypothetical protein
MKILIPKKVIAEQINMGELFGDFWASWNLDLSSNAGKIRVSPTVLPLATSTSLATMVKPVAFVRNLSNTLGVDTYFAVCNQAIVKTPVANIAWVVDTGNTGTSPTTTLSSLYSDGVSFNGSLIVSKLTDVDKLTSGTWTTSWWVGTIGGSALTTGIAHPLCVSFNNLLLIGNGSNIASVDISNNFNNTRIILPTEYEIIWIKSSSSAVWIGARNKFGGEGKVFYWDGYSENFNGDYKIGSAITYSGVIKDGVCYTINGNGILLRFNGGGFTEVARLPIANDKFNVFDEQLTTYPINITRNGMAVIDNNIHILINASIRSDASVSYLIENMLSGIWEYSLETGLHHKYSMSNTSTDYIDFGSPHIIYAGALLATNDRRKFLAGSQVYNADMSGTETSLISSINYDLKKKLGYFITPQIQTQEVEEMWQKVWILYSRLKQSGDFIQLKYRTSVLNIPVAYQISAATQPTATWTSTTTFTTTDTWFSGVSIGDELQVLSGEGAGLSANITDISEVTGTYTVTIDYNLTGASGTFSYKITNWKKIDTATDLVSQNKEFGVGKNSNWIQFKIVMYGIGSVCSCQSNSPEVERLLIKSEPQLKAI